jgi:DNA replication protein DnaC
MSKKKEPKIYYIRIPDFIKKILSSFAKSKK